MPALRSDQIRDLEALYRSAEDGRVRIRALIVLLAADQHRNVSEIARVIRHHEETVRRWLTRYLEAGIGGLYDAPKTGAPPKITREYRAELHLALHQSPAELGLPAGLWTGERLAEHLYQRTGIRVSPSSIYRLMRQERVEAVEGDHGQEEDRRP